MGWGTCRNGGGVNLLKNAYMNYPLIKDTINYSIKEAVSKDITFNNGAVFNGTTSCIITGVGIPKSAVVVECAFTPNRVTGNAQAVWHGNGGVADTLYLTIDGGYLKYGNSSSVISVLAITAGTKYVAKLVSTNGTSCQIYVNDVLAVSPSFYNRIATNMSIGCIGTSINSISYQFSGTIHYLKAY